MYERYSKETSHILETKKEWKSCVHLCENIFRKEEHDWKMVYLDRTEGCDQGKIQWKFDFSKEHFKIKNIDVAIETAIYENAKIDIQYLNEKGELLGSKDNLVGLSKFTLQLVLSGGKFWQHAQLFRQSKSATNYPLQVNITFQ